MFRHKYKFTDKSYSVGGIISIFMGLCSLVSFICAIVFSFKQRGNGGMIVGITALCSLMSALFGCIIGLLSYKEKDKYYTYSYVGSLFDGVMTILLISLLLIGL